VGTTTPTPTPTTLVHDVVLRRKQEKYQLRRRDWKTTQDINRLL